MTRAFTLIYTLSLLTLLTRIQLNLLGRRNYLSSVVSLATPPANAETISLEDHDDGVGQMFGNDYETNRRYLTFSWWLLHRGWKDLMEKVQAAVKETFGPVNPREDITIGKLSELTLQVRKKIEGATEEERRYVNLLLIASCNTKLLQVQELVAIPAAASGGGRHCPSGIRGHHLGSFVSSDDRHTATSPG